ncbi:hypothetical protein BJF78_28590 [Pseudonocardia sp. CNS-139]|nr:hypothetical protein BJF78_28590 [Pseudonocardia sp. CNS-139]
MTAPTVPAPRSALRAGPPGRPAWRVLLPPAGALLAVASALPVAAGVPGAVTLPFLLLAPAAVATGWVRTSFTTLAALGPVAGWCLLSVLASVALWVGGWDPFGATAVLALVVAVAGAVRAALDRDALAALARTVPAALTRRPRPARRTLVLTGVAAGTALLWAVALPAIRGSEPSPWGLAGAAPVTYVLAAAVPPVLLLWAVRARWAAGAVVAVGLAVLVYRAVGPLGTEAPRTRGRTSTSGWPTRSCASASSPPAWTSTRTGPACSPPRRGSRP